MITTHQTLDSCEVAIDPQKVTLPAKLKLSLSNDGAIHLENQMIVRPCELSNGEMEARFQEIRRALEEGGYTLAVSDRGDLDLKIGGKSTL